MKQTDLILKNGMIYTMAREGDVVEALAVRDGKIVYTGTTEEVLAACEAPQVVDLAGKTMLPGMGDSHLHFFAYCQTHTTVDLGGCTSKAETIGKLGCPGSGDPQGPVDQRLQLRRVQVGRRQRPPAHQSGSGPGESGPPRDDEARVSAYRRGPTPRRWPPPVSARAMNSAPVVWWSWTRTACPTASCGSRPPRSSTS